MGSKKPHPDDERIIGKTYEIVNTICYTTHMSAEKETTNQNKTSFKGLGLHWRLFFAFVMTSLVPVSLICVLVYYSLFSGLRELQESRISDALTRTLYGLEQQGAQLASNVQDYAHWEDMYNPDTGRDPEWQRINITEWIPSQFDVDVIVLADRDGNVYYQYQAPTEFSSNIKDFPPFTNAFEGVETHELYASSNGLMVVAASFVSPAINADNPFSPQDAPAVLIYARYLDSSVAQALRESVGGEIHFFGATELLGTSDESTSDLVGLPLQSFSNTVQNVLTSSEPIITETSESVTAFTRLQDVFGQPVGVVSITLSKATERFVESQFLTTILVSLMVSMTVACGLGLLLGWQLTDSIRRLSHAVLDYTDGKISHAPMVDRKDEIGQLQQAFSNMIDSLEKSKSKLLQHQSDLKKSNEQFRRNSRDLQQTQRILQERVNELKELNEVMVGRELRMAELKKEVKQLSKSQDKPVAKKRKRS
jgi:sensor domain CHASE-containing protein/HAMP domain-containing protein